MEVVVVARLNQHVLLVQYLWCILLTGYISPLL